MVFPLNWAYVDKTTRYMEDANRTRVNTMSSELLSKIYPRCSKRNTNFKARMWFLQRRVSGLKEAIIPLLEDHCEWGLSTMKSLLLHHLYGDLERFGSILILDAGCSL